MAPSLTHPASNSRGDEGIKRAPHAFAIPYPVQGHIHPMMRLCTALAEDHGFIISFLNTEANHKAMVDKYDEEGGKSAAIRLLWLPDDVSREESLEHGHDGASHTDNAHIALTKAFFDTDPRALEELIRSQTPPVTCFILDLIIPPSIPLLAQKLGIPRSFFFTASAASLRMAIVSGETDGDEKSLLACPLLPSPLVLEPFDLNPYLKVCGKPSDFMCRAFNVVIREKVLHRGDTILINTVEEAEAPTLLQLRKEKRDLLLNLWPIGPLRDDGSKHSNVPMSLWKSDYSSLSWLDTHPPHSVLLVSFGSLAPLTPSQLIELAIGLEESGHRILWVIRPDQIIGSAATASHAHLPPDFLERNKARLLVVSWLPQHQVLAHPSLGGFFTHCGWNSVLESISSGVPMLTWPFFGDQMQNARFVCDVWSVGIPLLAPGCARITCGIIAKRVKQFMEGETARGLRERAQDFKRIVDLALAPQGSSHDNVLRLAQQLANGCAECTTK